MTLVTPATNSDQTRVCSFSKKILDRIHGKTIYSKFRTYFVRVYLILILNHLLCLNTEPILTFLLFNSPFLR
jgi:hypothetical protein